MSVEFCNPLRNEFCLSGLQKSERMESISFYLQRRLAWQIRFMGPLFTTPAFISESSNRMLIALLTGTLNQCQLNFDKFIGSKFVAKINVEKDCLAGKL